MAERTEVALAELVEAITKDPLQTQYTSYRLRGSQSGQQVLSLSSSDQIVLIRYLFNWLKQPEHRATYPQQYVQGRGWQGGWDSVLGALGDLLRSRLTLPTDLVLEVIEVVTQPNYCGFGQKLHLIPARELLTHTWQALVNTGQEPPPELRQGAEVLCCHLQRYNPYEATILRSLIQPNTVEIPLQPGEAWTDCALTDLRSLPLDDQRIWVDLFKICWIADGSKPNQSWWKWVETPIAQIGSESLQPHLANWLNLAAQPRTGPVNVDVTGLMERYSHQDGASNLYAMATTNASTLKGLCWVASRYPSPEIVGGLEQVVLAAFHTGPKAEPLCIRLGNAAIWALGHIANFDSTMCLVHLSEAVEMPIAQKSIIKALTAAAQKAGVA